MLVSSPLDFFELGRAESVHRPSRTRKSFSSHEFSLPHHLLSNYHGVKSGQRRDCPGRNSILIDGSGLGLGDWFSTADSTSPVARPREQSEKERPVPIWLETSEPGRQCLRIQCMGPCRDWWYLQGVCRTTIYQATRSSSLRLRQKYVLVFFFSWRTSFCYMMIWKMHSSSEASAHERNKSAMSFAPIWIALQSRKILLDSGLSIS